MTLAIAAGQVVGLVGESGSGKSLTALAILRLTPPQARLSGHILLDGNDLLALPESAVARLRGRRVAMIFQDPAAALDPVMKVGAQLAETLLAHGRAARRGMERAVAAALTRVALDPALARRYPHQLSGGQRQRALIALALAAGPALLLADEPTTALDATVQASILDLLEGLASDTGLSILLISHDLAAVAERADRIAVMYAGEIVEEGPAAALLDRPAHPYTRALWRSSPRLGERPAGRLPALEGQPPAPGSATAGCPFAPRCPEALPVCRSARPPVIELASGPGSHRARCFLLAGEGGGEGA